MIDDDLLDLTADCYVALRSRGYLQDCPTFEGFIARTLGPESLPGDDEPSLASLPPAGPPACFSAN